MVFGIKKGVSKKAQVTVFIIIAIVIVTLVAGYFVFRGRLFKETGIPTHMEPVYNTFLNCIQGDTVVGIGILETQGGYIELPTFVSGSGYMPFGSQLNFLGNPIPYWYYVSGNGIQKEQVPTTTLMEEQLSDYIEGKIRNCIFEQYVEDGYDVNMGEPEVSASINAEDVVIDVDLPLTIERADETAIVRSHNVVVNSKLGTLYESARELYDYEQETLFLENYGVDVLRMYAPVDGVEMSCSPMMWNAEDVFDDLEDALSANVQAIRVKSGDFELANPDNKYFVVDAPVKENVRFLTSKNWPNSFEVSPSSGAMLIAKPVGNNPGMAAMGFCYVPYHFVYDMKYPVLMQVYDGEEIFQFPVAVVILGNMPREPIEGALGYDIPNSEMCDYKNTNWGIYTFDTKLNPVSANISFKCFNEICDIGYTNSESGYLEELVPQCVAGSFVAMADGYEDKTYLVETSSREGIADILMSKIYEKRVEFTVNNAPYNDNAIITFEKPSESISRTITYPRERNVKLSAGNWTVRVYAYGNTSITIPASTQEECVDAPKTGIAGFFGMTEKKCFDITIPAQTIDSAVKAGGNQVYYILEEELVSSSIIDINADGLPSPRNIDDLQKNYQLLEESGLDIELR